MIPYEERGYRLLHQGAITLAEIESNGIRVDNAYLESVRKSTALSIKARKKALEDMKMAKEWRRIFKTRTNYESVDQLRHVVYEAMGYKASDKRTKAGKLKTDKMSLASFEDPFLKEFLAIKEQIKAKQFLDGIAREVVDGFLHPSFNLHVARTYRSSSSDPNFQNLPVRNEDMARTVRRCFIARKRSKALRRRLGGRRLVELDYGGIEVKVSACYNKDPNLIRYIKDPTTDMHRDMAMECFIITPEEWAKIPKDLAKQIRYVAKNKFVFPQFYGSYWLDCAGNLWDDMVRMKLKISEEMSLRKWLRKKGIKELGDQDKEKNEPTPGSFEEHIAEVQKPFWGERFKVYDQWRRDEVAKYHKRGWAKTLTGFIIQGQMKRNQIVNYPIQGSAFHCLLWSLNKLVAEIRKRGMSTLIVGQIHDSIVADVPEEEVDDYLRLCREITVERLMEEWKWIIVPLEIEAEICPVDGTWADKQKIEIPA